MLLKRNLLENLMILSISGTILCILLNYITNISLLTGVWFLLYILTLFIVSVLLSFKCIQWLLHLNKPLKYDVDVFVKRYPYLAFLKNYLPNVKKPVAQEWKEYDTNELSVISTVLERNLVSSWYLPYVSQDIGFPFACKQMLDQMIGNAFKICHKIDSKEVFIDMCTILIIHFKEYKKALKRQEKSPECSIESLYKMSHPISDPSKKYTSADHCTNIVRILMKELIPFELWDTPHSELLVRILSKKLDMYIENTLADPIWINDKIMIYLTGEEYVESEKLPKEESPIEISIKTEMTPEPVKMQVEIAEEIKPQEDMKMESIIEEHSVTSTSPLDIKSSPVLRQKRGRQGRNEVKIYDRIIEGSVKTWETDMDLQCISLGQDLLASLDGEITLSRLWGQDGEAESSPERAGGRSPLPLWFGEEEALELEEGTAAGQVTGPGPRHSPKAADVLKELSSTVSQAKNKIGDLQVRPAQPYRADEAAGMMEGLLDFGIAGLKKGLRFTGLSDDTQDKSPSHREKGDRSSPESRHKTYPDLGSYSLTQKEGETGNGAVPQLVKQHRVTSQDSVPIGRGDVGGIPSVTPLSESPEPQYEEAADLSSSIAKLRCLLRQREPPPREEEVWWEGAEETRGRTHHHHSERPVDTATLADEYDMSMDRNVSPNQGANNMQRLDKLFQRTVTGVFNSLKTAVGGEEAAAAPRADWSFVSGGGGRGAACARLLAAAARARGAPRAVRTRHAAVERLRTRHDVDDLEECDGAWSGVLGAASAACPVPHAAARLATLLLADVAENIITVWLFELSATLRERAFAGIPPAAEARARRPREPAVLERLLLERAKMLQVLFGRETARACIEIVVSSTAQRDIVRDIAHRALDLIALHARAAARHAPTPAE